MKYFIVLSIVACFIRFSECVTEQMREQIFKQMTTQCAAKEGASAADIEGMLKFKPTNTPKSKCLEAFLAEVTGVIKNNHVDPEGAAAISAIIYEGEDKRINDARDIAKKCLSVTADDRCLAAFAIMECASEAAKAFCYHNGIYN